MIDKMNNTKLLPDILDCHPNLIIFTLDRGYKYIYFNNLHKKLMKRLWNVDIELNQSILNYISLENGQKIAKSNFDKVLNGEQFTIVEEYGEKTEDRPYFKNTYYPLKDDTNSIYGICVFVEDFTFIHSENEEVVKTINELEEQVRIRTKDLELTNENLIEENQRRMMTERELNSMKLKIEQSLVNEMELNKLKTKFISMVSHEFRTPLTIIQTATFLLEKSFERNDMDKFYKNLDKVNKSIQSMTELMENVLNIGKLEHGEIKASKKVFDIKKEIDSLIKSNNNYNKIVKLKLPDEAVFVDSDRILCNQIVNNLLSNAVKYSGLEPEIKLYMTADGYKCNISIKDNGIGIAKESISSMTEAFKREDKISSLIQGTGLGLSIVKHNLDLIGGTMNIESEVDSGTTVTVTIPR